MSPYVMNRLNTMATYGKVILLIHTQPNGLLLHTWVARGNKFIFGSRTCSLVMMNFSKLNRAEVTTIHAYHISQAFCTSPQLLPAVTEPNTTPLLVAQQPMNDPNTFAV